MSDHELERIAAAAHARFRADHTSARRAEEMLAAFEAPRAAVFAHKMEAGEMWGIIPAAGRGSRIQPLAFSKELLPVGSRREGGRERPCAVSEYLLERMVKGGVDKVCFVISPGKSDIMEYFGGRYGPATIAYVVQPEPLGLCDAIFRAAPLIGRGRQRGGRPSRHHLVSR